MQPTVLQTDHQFTATQNCGHTSYLNAAWGDWRLPIGGFGRITATPITDASKE